MNSRELRVHFFGALIALIVVHCPQAQSLSKSCAAALLKNSEYPGDVYEWTYYFPMAIDLKSIRGYSKFHKKHPEVAPEFLTYRKSTFHPDKEAVYTDDELHRDGITFQETKKILQKLYELYAKRETVDSNWIASLRDLDSTLQVDYLSYIAFFDSKTREPQVMIRIVDISPSYVRRSKIFSLPKDVKIPIELEYPHLILPERLLGQSNLIELGRLGKEKTVEGDLDVLFRAVSVYLYQSHNLDLYTDGIGHPSSDPIIYIECSRLASRLYQNLGFSQIYGPEQVGVADTYIMRIPALDFVRRFHWGPMIYRTR